MKNYRARNPSRNRKIPVWVRWFRPQVELLETRESPTDLLFALRDIWLMGPELGSGLDNSNHFWAGDSSETLLRREPSQTDAWQRPRVVDPPPPETTSQRTQRDEEAPTSSQFVAGSMPGFIPSLNISLLPEPDFEHPFGKPRIPEETGLGGPSTPSANHDDGPSSGASGGGGGSSAGSGGSSSGGGGGGSAGNPNPAGDFGGGSARQPAVPSQPQIENVNPADPTAEPNPVSTAAPITSLPTNAVPPGPANPATVLARPDLAVVRAGNGGGPVTIDAHGRQLRNVHAVTSPTPAVDGATLPYGMFAFDIAQMPPGGSVTIDMTLPQDALVDTYFKQDPNTGAMERFDYDGQTGAEIAGNVVTLHYVDGGRGDADGLANGVIVDPGGPSSGVIFVDCANGLDDWTVFADGGTPAGQGTVIHDEATQSFVLREGDSFQTGLKRRFVVPESPSIVTFRYSDLIFDTTDLDSMNDAFEAAFVDDQGHTLVYTIGPDRDAYFNITEGLPAAIGRWTSLEDLTVNLDISTLAPGIGGTLIFRLVNNDSDTNTTVHIACVDDDPPTATIHLQNDTAPTGPGSEPYLTDLLTNDPRVASY